MSRPTRTPVSADARNLDQVLKASSMSEKRVRPGLTILAAGALLDATSRFGVKAHTFVVFVALLLAALLTRGIRPHVEIWNLGYGRGWEAGSTFGVLPYLGCVTLNSNDRLMPVPLGQYCRMTVGMSGHILVLSQIKLCTHRFLKMRSHSLAVCSRFARVQSVTYPRNFTGYL